MKKVCLFLSLALLTVAISSCVENSKQYKALQAENQSLVAQKTNLETEYNKTMATINEIENSLQAIQEAEGMMSMNMENKADNNKIVNDMMQLKQVLEQNRTKIADLEQQLSKSKKNNGALAATVKRLKEELAQKEEAILALQTKVDELTTQVSGLNATVAGLNSNLDAANKLSEEQQSIIDGQTSELNTVYYVIGTKKDLKSKGIINKKYLMNQEVSMTNFTKADKRELTSLPLNTKKAVVMSSNPVGSYEIVTGEDGMKVLNILDSRKFWSVTDYLVIVAK